MTLLSIFLVIALAEPAPAVQIDAALVQQLDSAARLSQIGNWTEALPIYLELMDTSGAKLVPHPQEPDLFIPLRQVCQRAIADAPMETQQRYRWHIDPIARKWFETGKATNDVLHLRRVVTEARHSSFGQPAADLLGDLLFEKGRFDEADEAWEDWERINEPAEPRPRVRAKRLLAAWFSGRHRDFDSGLREYRQQHPNATGTIAGRTDAYATILESIAAEEKPARPADWSHLRLLHESPLAATSAPKPTEPSRVRAGRVIVSSLRHGLISAVETETNIPAWTAAFPFERTPEPKTHGPPSVGLETTNLHYSQRRVFTILAGDSRILCLDAGTGRLLWQTPIADPRQFVGVFDNLLLAVSGRDVRALDIRTGVVRWRSFAAGPVGSGGVLVHGERVLWSTANGLRVLNLHSGAGALDPQVGRMVPEGLLRLDAELRLTVSTANRQLVYQLE